MEYPPPTAQQIFDQVVTHLFTQGRPAMQPGNKGCAYFNPETGHTCAMGVLVPEKHRSRRFDEGNHSPADVIHMLKREGVINYLRHADLIQALQRVHDHADTYPDTHTFHLNALAHDLYEVAKEFKLNASVIATQLETASP